MGWLVWLLESALCVWASYVVAVAIYHDRGILDRIITTMLVSTSLILIAVHACGMVERLAPWPLGIFSFALFSTVFLIAWRIAGRARTIATLRSDLGAPLRLVREAWTLREPAVLVMFTAAAATAICAIMIWYFRSWTWDPAWYHVPKTLFAVQNHSVSWIRMPNPFTQGNPQHVEMLAVWNCVFQRDNRLDDSSQLPFLLLGAASIAAWSRSVGATRPFAAAVGAAWITLPPVFLQGHSTHVDIAWNSLFVTAIYFACPFPFTKDCLMLFVRRLPILSAGQRSCEA